jgi:hypothetical protein
MEFIQLSIRINIKFVVLKHNAMMTWDKVPLTLNLSTRLRGVIASLSGLFTPKGGAPGTTG